MAGGGAAVVGGGAALVGGGAALVGGGAALGGGGCLDTIVLGVLCFFVLFFDFPFLQFNFTVSKVTNFTPPPRKLLRLMAKMCRVVPDQLTPLPTHPLSPVGGVHWGRLVFKVIFRFLSNLRGEWSDIGSLQG